MEIEQLIREKCTLKDIEFSAFLTNIIDGDVLFLTPAGLIIGKPYKDGSKTVFSQVLLTDVAFIKNGTVNNLVGTTFALYSDQVIGMTPVDRKSFLEQLPNPER